jgi:hypothetical protein
VGFWGSTRGASWKVAALSALSFAAAVGVWACSSNENADPGFPNADSDAGNESGTVADEDVFSPEKEAGNAAGFCENLSLRERGRAKLCDSFDDGNLENGWEVRTANRGEATLDPELKKSGAASYFVKTEPLAAAESANVHLRATAKGAPTGHVILSFALFLTQATFTTGAIGIATLDVAQNHFFTLYLRDDDANTPAATLDEASGGTRTRHLLTKLPPINVWTRVIIDIDLEGSLASVTYDGEETLAPTAIATLPALDPTIRLGAVYAFGPMGSFEAHFDDVALDF